MWQGNDASNRYFFASEESYLQRCLSSKLKNPPVGHTIVNRGARFTQIWPSSISSAVVILKISHENPCKTQCLCSSSILLTNNGFICGVWHQPGWTLFTQQMVQKSISTFSVHFKIMTQILCFVVTCIPVKVIFKTISWIDPSTSKLTCDSRDLRTKLPKAA